MVHCIFDRFQTSASYNGSFSPIDLGNSMNGSFLTQLPAGPAAFQNNIFLSVHVFDDSGGVTVFPIATPVQVFADQTVIETFMDNVLQDSETRFFEKFRNMSLKDCVQDLVNHVCLINSIQPYNLSNRTETERVVKLSKVKEALTDFINDLKVVDLTEIQMVASIILSLTDGNLGRITQKSAVSIFAPRVLVFKSAFFD